MANTKLTGLTAVSVPALSDLTYLVDVSDTADDAAGSSRQLSLDRLLGLLVSVADGRLSTESGVSVSTSDRTAQSTLYYTPHVGNTVSLYDGTRWRLYSFTQRSLTLSGLTSGTNYDVFLFDSSGTLTLELTAWTNDTTRATALTTQDGVLVRSGATTRRYLGTIRATGTTTTEDSRSQRFVWNAHNQLPRPLSVTDATTSWGYGSATWRSANNSTANRVGFVCGLAGTLVTARVTACGLSTAATNGGSVGIGLDRTTGNDAQAISEVLASATANMAAHAAYTGYPSAGYHYLQWVESTRTGSVTWYGTNSYATSTLFAEVMG